jgi:hypothetical protein
LRGGLHLASDSGGVQGPAATIRVAEILGMMLDEDLAVFGEHRDELAALLPLLGAQRFDRRQVNRGLAALATTRARAA